MPPVPILCVPNLSSTLYAICCSPMQFQHLSRFNLHYMPSLTIMYVLNLLTMSRNRFPYLPVTLHTRRYYFWNYSDLGELEKLVFTLPMPEKQFLYLPVTLHTRRYCFLTHPVLRELMFTLPMSGNHFLQSLVTLRT